MSLVDFKLTTPTLIDQKICEGDHYIARSSNIVYVDYILLYHMYHAKHDYESVKRLCLAYFFHFRQT